MRKRRLAAGAALVAGTVLALGCGPKPSGQEAGGGATAAPNQPVQAQPYTPPPTQIEAGTVEGREPTLDGKSCKLSLRTYETKLSWTHVMNADCLSPQHTILRYALTDDGKLTLTVKLRYVLQKKEYYDFFDKCRLVYAAEGEPFDDTDYVGEGKDACEKDRAAKDAPTERFKEKAVLAGTLAPAELAKHPLGGPPRTSSARPDPPTGSRSQ